MAREIKFRVWDKRFVRMSHELMEGYGIGMTGGFGLLDRKGNLTQSAEFELMQFTGLLDKNGKEIYEGDVVDYSTCALSSAANMSCNRMQGAIEWHVDHPYPGYRIAKHRAWHPQSLLVIGNIYENPELLN